MKKIIVAVLIMAFIPISYAAAEDKETVDAVSVKTSMPSEGYLPLPAKHKYYYYIEGQRRIIGFDRMGSRDEITNLLNEYENKKINTSPYSWKFMPDIREGQPELMIQISYSF